MKENPIMRIFGTTCLLAFFMFAGSMVRSSVAQTCDSTTDSQIAASVNEKFAANRSLAKQLTHINVLVKSGAVILQGWTDSASDKDKAVQLIAEVKCVRLINLNEFSDTPPPADSPLRARSGSCASGTKACGDVCIPDGDSCNITSKP